MDNEGAVAKFDQKKGVWVPVRKQVSGYMHFEKKWLLHDDYSIGMAEIFFLIIVSNFFFLKDCMIYESRMQKGLNCVIGLLVYLILMNNSNICELILQLVFFIVCTCYVWYF